MLMLRVAVVAVLAATPALAWADEDNDAPTSVQATLVGTNVRMQATFAFDVQGPFVALDLHTFAIPSTAVVTSGAAIVGGKRHRLRLEPAESVERAFDALTLKPGSNDDRAWALAIDAGSSAVSVDVLAPYEAHVVLELTLDAPTCFYKDARYVELPSRWWQRLPAARRASHASDAELSEACGKVGDDGDTQWLGFASRHLVEQPAGERRIGTIAGRLSLDTTSFARVEIDLARELGDVPADLHTVIVVDHSRSMSADELEAQRAIVAAYVRAAPTSRVQVIGYTRRAEPLLPSWMVASHAAPRLDRAIRALPPRNGSNIDAALTEAATWLARVPGTRRIVLFSDERLADRLAEEPAALRALLPADTLVHVVHPASHGFGIERADDSMLAPLAAATNGIATFAATDDDGNIDATMLLRPVSLDHIAIGSSGWQTVDAFVDAHACETRLVEGQTCTWWGEGAGAAGPVMLTGLLWNTPVARVLRPDPSQARTLARMLSVIQVFDADLQRQIDRVAFAVNSVWSLFAQWGGSGGYEEIGGFGTLRRGGFGGSTHDTGIGRPGPGRGSITSELQGQLRSVVHRCRPGDARVTLDVETTLEEIVTLAVEVTPADGRVHDCIEEAVWDTTLRIANAPAHARSLVAFGNNR